MGLTLLGQQMPLRDLHLFLVRVAGNFDDLHAVEQRARNGVERVGRHDEHHTAQVDGNFKIVVAEGTILLAVEHFQKCRRGIAAPVAAHLVDLVEHEQRVHRAAAGNGFDNAAGHRADVGLAVAADIRLVAHAAERQPRDLAVHRLGDRQRDRRLADARRADETQNLPLRLGVELAHGDELQNALLDLLQAVVVAVENLARGFHAGALFRLHAPRHLHAGVEIIAQHARLGAAERLLGELVHVL